MKTLYKTLDALGTILIVAFIVSLMLSFLTAFSTSRTCKTYAYYLPATYTLCNLVQYRPGYERALGFDK